MSRLRPILGAASLMGPTPRPSDRGATPLGRLALGGAALGCAALALLPGAAGPVAARAGLAALAVALAWGLARRRLASAAPPPPLRIAALAPLGRSAEVALVEVDGRRFLIGCGERPLALLAELSPAPGSRP